MRHSLFLLCVLAVGSVAGRSVPASAQAPARGPDAPPPTGPAAPPAAGPPAAGPATQPAFDVIDFPDPSGIRLDALPTIRDAIQQDRQWQKAADEAEGKIDVPELRAQLKEG